MFSFAVPVAAGPYEDAQAAARRGDFATAVRLIRPLAEQDYARAKFYLGAMYDHGNGVPQSDAEAVKWYRLAADRGYAAALNQSHQIRPSVVPFKLNRVAFKFSARLALYRPQISFFPRNDRARTIEINHHPTLRRQAEDIANCLIQFEHFEGRSGFCNAHLAVCVERTQDQFQ